MGDILKFRPASTASGQNRRLEEGAEAQILIFSGVRYEPIRQKRRQRRFVSINLPVEMSNRIRLAIGNVS